MSVLDTRFDLRHRILGDTGNRVATAGRTTLTLGAGRDFGQRPRV
jgi:hypothetical protein